jgi:hypothetical protein
MKTTPSPQLQPSGPVLDTLPPVNDALLSPPCGYTPAELARHLRVSPDQIRCWIKSGELGAINTARRRCGRPRYVILPHHLADFSRQRSAAEPRPSPRRRRRRHVIDFYPD